MDRPNDKQSAVEITILPEYCRKSVLILGCGSKLLGDDGFGPAVADCLVSEFTLPEEVCVVDAGTGVRKLLTALALSPERPKEIVFVDAVDRGKTPGEIFELPLSDLPPERLDDFSLHPAPTTDLARSLQSAGVTVRVLACQPEVIPSSVAWGLSETVHRAVSVMCDALAERYGAHRREEEIARTEKEQKE